MLLLNHVYPIGLIVVLLMVATPGCSGSDKPPGGNVARSSDVRGPLDDIHDLYRAGSPEKAREMTLRYMDSVLAGMKTGKQLAYKLDGAAVLAGTTEVVTVWEKEVATSNGKPPDEASRKAVATYVEKMEQGNSLVAKETANAALSPRDRQAIRDADKSRTKAIKNWILMNPSDKREDIYRQYQEFLESQKIKPADLVNASDATAPSTDDQRLLDSAKADIEQIRKLIGSYYRAIFSGDADALRATLSEKVTDKQVSRMLAKWKEEKKKHAVDKVASVDLDKAVIEAEQVADNRVVIRAKGIKVTIESNGQTSVVDRENVFRVLKENERWILWFQ